MHGRPRGVRRPHLLVAAQREQFPRPCEGFGDARRRDLVVGDVDEPDALAGGDQPRGDFLLLLQGAVRCCPVGEVDDGNCWRRRRRCCRRRRGGGAGWLDDAHFWEVFFFFLWRGGRAGAGV